MGTHGKEILVPGADSCIVIDQKCTIIAEFGKKKPALTADGVLVVKDCLVTSSLFNYLHDYCKQFTITIAFLSLFQ